MWEHNACLTPTSNILNSRLTQTLTHSCLCQIEPWLCQDRIWTEQTCLFCNKYATVIHKYNTLCFKHTFTILAVFKGYITASATKPMKCVNSFSCMEKERGTAIIYAAVEVDQGLFDWCRVRVPRPDPSPARRSASGACLRLLIPQPSPVSPPCHPSLGCHPTLIGAW